MLKLQSPVQPSHAGAAAQPSRSQTNLVIPSAPVVFFHAPIHHLSTLDQMRRYFLQAFGSACVVEMEVEMGVCVTDRQTEMETIILHFT